jgi:hypothetical protein
MSTRIRIMAMIGLAVALSPAFAHARNGEGVKLPVRHLVAIPGATASTSQGRTAERAPLQPVFTLSDPAMETAGIDSEVPDTAAGS